MKPIITLLLLLSLSVAHAQWTRVAELPSTDIYTLYRKGNVLYSGGTDKIYYTSDGGQSWDSTAVIPGFVSVDNIIVFKNELFASSFSRGVVKSIDGGNTWLDVRTGIFPFISDFCEGNGDLYASTMGASIFKLDPVTRSSWQLFSNGLSNLSLNVTSITANSQALVAGTNNNAIYDYSPFDSNAWEERLLLALIRPTEKVHDIITAHDTMFLTTSARVFYMSVDNGFTWSTFGNTPPISNFISLTNAKEAVLVARCDFSGSVNNTTYYFIKKDELDGPLVPFSEFPDHFSYKMEIYGGKLWDASFKGLFTMPLSVLPGITDASDTIAPVILPVRFVSVQANCNDGKVLVTWVTAEEQNSSHYEVERSADGVRWEVIGRVQAAGNSSAETRYSFIDISPRLNGFYRIAEYDLDGQKIYSSVASDSCKEPGLFTYWPNPVRDELLVRLSATHDGMAELRLFDARGALVKVKSEKVVPGINQFGLDMHSLSKGSYTLMIVLDNGEIKRTAQLLKQ